MTESQPCPVGASPVRREESWWRCLFEHAEDAQLVCDQRGLILEANPRAGFLCRPGTAPGRGVTALPETLTDSTRVRLLTLLRSGLRGQSTLSGVTLLSGQRLVMMADLQIAPLGDGHFLVTIRDSSRRWRIESHMQRLVTALDATPDVFFLTDGEHRITYVNTAFQAVTGFSIEDALGRAEDFLRAPGQGRLIKAYRETVREGRDWVGELQNLRHDGSTYPVAVTFAPIFDSGGGFIGFVASERDITQRQQLQDQLRQERDFVRSILNSVEAAVYTVTPALCLTHVNEVWRSLPPQQGWLRVDSAPQIGQSLLSLVPDARHREELARMCREVLANGRAQELQFAAHQHHWWMKLSPLQNAGATGGVILQVVDQTRLQELQKQLYQAQKMETIGALSAGVAHDFNNLLQAIRGNTNLMLADESLATALRSKLEQVDRAAERAAGITRQLLAFSRDSEEEVTVFDFNELLQETSLLVKRSLRARVDLQVTPAAHPVRVRMDATRASQLLLNLCVNAQDAMAHGGTLTLQNQPVALSETQAQRAHVVLGTPFVRCTVADTGMGIPPEVLPRIFDPFFTTKEVGKGTGLGLSIVHSVVTRSLGFIEIESTAGQGTAFHVYLPLVEGASPKFTQQVRRAAGRGSGRVLVVDDLDLVRDFSKAFLCAVGALYLKHHHLPEVLVDAALHHHAPEQAGSDAALVAVVHLANQLTHVARIGRSGNPAVITEAEWLAAPAWDLLFPPGQEEARALARAALRRKLEHLPLMIEKMI
ncbi:MAG: PAS domain-containing sensor histidine kinase [Proteobacteria bacterium]|nr:PAS domain-containing sensor histidine kinase [Pseudomonadota bacterium]